MSRAKVMARTSKRDRERLAEATPAMLAMSVKTAAEQMERDARRMQDLRETIRQRTADAFGDASVKTARFQEAHQLAHNRATLLAICDEMRLRIDHLLAGNDVGDGCPRAAGRVST